MAWRRLHKGSRDGVSLPLLSAFSSSLAVSPLSQQHFSFLQPACVLMPITDPTRRTLKSITTTANGTADLLTPIPSFPPLELPDSSPLISPEEVEAFSTVLPASASYMTDSFAYTPSNSSSHGRTSNVAGVTSYSESFAQSLSQPSNLRKSISVDSFIRHRRGSPLGAVGRQGRTNAIGIATEESRSSTQDPALAWQPASDGPTVSYQERDSRFPLSGRSRGVSISTTLDDYDHSLVADSDNERLDDLPRLGDGARRTSSKGKDRLRSILPPGELPLPSRLPALSLSSSMSRLTSGTCINTREDAPRPLLVSPAFMSRYPETPFSSGIRSKSLGFDKGDKRSTLSSLNTKALDVCLLLFYF